MTEQELVEKIGELAFLDFKDSDIKWLIHRDIRQILKAIRQIPAEELVEIKYIQSEGLPDWDELQWRSLSKEKA